MNKLYKILTIFNCRHSIDDKFITVNSYNFKDLVGNGK